VEDSAPAVAYGAVYVSSGDFMYVFEAGSGRQLWRTTLPDAAGPSPVVANGVVYVGSGANLVALNAATGDVLWKGATATTIQAPPIVANGTVYVSASNNLLYAFALPAATADAPRADMAKLHTAAAITTDLE
jgi:eukaryotic-like serine/threonine-protein kinase